jgi:hypothetical protein
MMVSNIKHHSTTRPCYDLSQLPIDVLKMNKMMNTKTKIKTDNRQEKARILLKLYAKVYLFSVPMSLGKRTNL